MCMALGDLSLGLSFTAMQCRATPLSSVAINRSDIRMSRALASVIT